jgi:hypothetical protein
VSRCPDFLLLYVSQGGRGGAVSRLFRRFSSCMSSRKAFVPHVQEAGNSARNAIEEILLSLSLSLSPDFFPVLSPTRLFVQSNGVCGQVCEETHGMLRLYLGGAGSGQLLKLAPSICNTHFFNTGPASPYATKQPGRWGRGKDEQALHTCLVGLAA